MSNTAATTSTDAPDDAACELDFSVAGMNCASCVAHVTKTASSMPGVRDVNVNLARGKAHVVYDESRTSAKSIADALTASGYPTEPESPDRPAHELEAERLHTQHEHAQGWLKRFIIAAVLWAPVEATHWIVMLTSGSSHHAHPSLWMPWLSFATSAVALVLVGGGFYKSAWGALKRRTTNMDTLIALGASVAFGYSAIAFFGYLAGAWRELPELYFMESTGLLALVSLGHWLEARSRASAGSAIHELMNLAPQTALRLSPAPLTGDGPSDAADGHLASVPAQARGSKPKTISLDLHASLSGAAPHSNPLPQGERGPDDAETVPVSQLSVGDLVLVRPGDRVATDGVVVSGRSSVDESIITGEAMPVQRGPGDDVIGGTVNNDGRLVIRVTKVGSATALAQIVKLVETAQSSKPPVQKLADNIAAIFVPSVLGIALLTGIGWFIAGHVNHWDAAQTWGRLAKSVCSVLIIACPCALGLAVPAALMVGTGRGAKRGILMRDIDALQSAERIDTVVLDKTGTITQGKPVVVNIVVGEGVEENELLRLAASAEQFSEHPIAKAIVAAARERKLELSEPQSFTNHPGLGIEAQVDGATLLVGNRELSADVTKNDTALPIDSDVAKTTVFIARKDDGRLLGALLIDDAIKPDSVAAIREFEKLGLNIVLLTGDNEATAQALARQVGIKTVHAGVKPAGKAEVIRKLQSEGKRVVMVGDGVNDAPALAVANLGIAIGSGSDVAKETGGIVLVSGSLHGVVTAIRLSRATMKKIRQNLFFAFLYNVLAIPLAAFGLLSPYVAAGAMAMSDVTVIGNALLLRRTSLDR